MSLLAFHRVLILVAVAFCLGFAGWELRAFAHGAGPGAALVAVIFAALAAILTVYLARLRSILRLPE
jgi:hypothetical protein